MILRLRFLVAKADGGAVMVSYVDVWADRGRWGTRGALARLVRYDGGRVDIVASER